MELDIKYTKSEIPELKSNHLPATAASFERVILIELRYRAAVSVHANCHPHPWTRTISSAWTSTKSRGNVE
jgi:hypothetical protein